ncbi:MAG: hypothetical protein AB8C95_13590, partial [Phycisphaeraceae bacterium]
ATAGFVGALLWAGLAYYGNLEIGLLAWGIGAAVGAAMMTGAAERASVQTGVLALVIALVSIVAGKYIAVEMVYNEFDSDWSGEIARLDTDDQYATSWIADDVIQEYEAQGKPVNYPPTANLDMPETQADYPTDVWAEANQRWLAMSAEEKADFRESVITEQKAIFDTISGDFKAQGFIESFSFFDILWFALGGISAFKLGAGLSSD